MREVDHSDIAAGVEWPVDDAFDAQIASLAEALTLAAAAPGRRRLDRLEELLLVRAGQASHE